MAKNGSFSIGFFIDSSITKLLEWKLISKPFPLKKAGYRPESGNAKRKHTAISQNYPHALLYVGFGESGECAPLYALRHLPELSARMSI